MKNDLIHLILFATVAIILTTLLLIPVISSAQEGQEVKAINTSSTGAGAAELVTMSEVDSSGVLMNFNGTALTINDNPIVIPTTNASHPLVLTDTVYAYATNGYVCVTMYGYLDGSDVGSCDTSANNSTPVSLTLSEGTATLVYEASGSNFTKTSPYTWGVYQDPNGDLIGSSNEFMNTLYYMDKVWTVSNIDGNIYTYNGTTAVKNGETTTYTNDATSYKGTPINEWSVSSTVEGSSFTFNTDTPVQPVAYIAPKTVTYSTSLDSSIITMLEIIPVLVIVAILATVVRIGVMRNE